MTTKSDATAREMDMRGEILTSVGPVQYRKLVLILKYIVVPARKAIILACRARAYYDVYLLNVCCLFCIVLLNFRVRCAAFFVEAKLSVSWSFLCSRRG